MTTGLFSSGRKALPGLVGFALLFLLLGCESPLDKTDRLRSASLTTRTCVVHKIALQPIRLYAQTGKGCYFYDREVFLAYARFPNAIPYTHTRESSSMFARAETVYYCPLCESVVMARLAPDAR